ncbi:TM198 protein, partial [Polyodon spathula]|nr:TM198 protein [Polyodon spathula]
GYRCFKAIMFLSGLLFGSIIIFLLCHKERVLDTELSVEVSAGIGLAIGLLCGLVTMLVRSVGLFMTGLLLGLLLAAAALVAMEQVYSPGTVWVPVGMLMGAGMLFAVLTLQWQKLFTVLSTSVFGAAIMAVCVDYFVEMLVLVQFVYDRVRLAPSPPLCWYSWVIMAVWPALSILGIVVQWKLTAEGFSHTEVFYLQSAQEVIRFVADALCVGFSLSVSVIISRRQKRIQLMRIRQKDAKKHQLGPVPEATYRRKSYPVKRYTGDVLAPVSDHTPNLTLTTHTDPDPNTYP